LGKEEKCNLCHESVEIKYVPMDEWNIEGILCGKCYSKKIGEFYPGEHVRVNLSDD
jgi:hypothetical protein